MGLGVPPGSNGGSRGPSEFSRKPRIDRAPPAKKWLVSGSDSVLP